MTDTTRAEDLVARLCGGIRHRRMYFSSHPEVQASARVIALGLRAFLDETGREFFFLGLAQGRLVHDGRLLVGSTLLGRRLVEFLERLRCGGLLFRAGIEDSDVLALFDVAAGLGAPTAGLEESRALLRAAGVRRIELSPPYEDAGWLGQFLYDREESGGRLEKSEADDLVPVYQSLFDTVDVAHSRAAAGRSLDVDHARSVVEGLLAAARGGFTDILRLVRYPDYDTYTVGHSVRVALLAVLVGNRLGCESSFLTELGAAGLMHDVGKAKIPEEILYKQGPLTPDERRIVSQHPCLGAQILLEHRNAGPLAVASAFGHHLRHDRRGYPQTEAWAATSRVTALVQVCDVFEAITAVRPYKGAQPPRRAYELMVADAGAYDPGALRAFVSAMGLYPPGSRVALATGERAVVLAAGRAIDRPTLRLSHAAGGEEIPEVDRPTIDLGAPESATLSIASLLVD